MLKRLLAYLIKKLKKLLPPPLSTINYKIENGFELKKAHDSDSCYDLKVRNDISPISIPSKGVALIPTGIFLELPSNSEAQIRPRSGLALKYGIFVLNSPGTIDSGYRGEIKVIVANFGSDVYIVKPGDKIAQIHFSYVDRFQVSQVSTINNSDRNEKGFGSTGV